MSRISVKHANQQSANYGDFSGGLNTSAAIEVIAQNELSKAVNVELDRSTGLLKTVAGTENIYMDDTKDFMAFAYDKQSDTFVICDTAGKIYFYHEATLTEKGTLTGDMYPAFAVWEDGLLIASGGKMQYAHGTTLETLADSPATCKGVFIKDGRVWTYYSDVLHCSATGDETTWESTSEVDSSSQWIEVGYKDGGKIAGVTNLSSDILIFKDNGHAFHLYGQYPDWTLKEISRDVQCKGDRSSVSLVNQAIVLGHSMVQSITTTDYYGEMRADNISKKIPDLVKAIPDTVRLKYLSSINQVWFITGKQRFLFMDCDNGAYFERKYTSPVVDALSLGEDVYVLKSGGIQRLKERIPDDEGKELRWEFWPKTLVSPNEYLVKRVRISITPEINRACECLFVVGDIPIYPRLPHHATAVYQDSTTVFQSRRSVYEPRKDPEYSSSEVVFQNPEEVYQSEMPLVSPSMYKTDVRCTHRARAVRIIGRGKGSKFLFNNINLEFVEV